MRKLRVLVLEDEWAARNYLTELLEATGLANVVAAVADTEQAWAALRSDEGALTVDAAFVDIRLAGEPTADAGVAWLRAASATPGSGELRFVLTTASRDHAIEAYEIGVTDYILKPFTGERVAQCLKKLILERPLPPITMPTRIVARHGKNLVFVPAAEVWAFEAADGLSYVYSPAGRYDVDLSLSALSASLGEPFVRVHRNWLVSLDAVRTLERETGETRLLVGAGGLAVPVARDRVTQVREALMSSAVGLRRIS